MRARGTRRFRMLLIVFAGLGALILLAFGAWSVFLHDTAKPASIDEALRRFRSQAEQQSSLIPQGVYVYATTGSEYVSALGGKRHRYPPRSTITVTKAGCGMALRWDVLEHRSNTWTICPEGGGERLAEWREEHQFFGQNDYTTWRCTGTEWLPASRDPGSTSRITCDGGDTKEAGTTTVIGMETMAAGGAKVEAVHMRTGIEEKGDARGPLVEDRWLEPESGLPLRMRYRVKTSNSSPIGDVTFEESYDIRLTSLEPRR